MPSGFTARPAGLSDAAAVAAVVAADERRHLGKAETTAEAVTASWAGMDLEQFSVVVQDGSGRVVAAGDMVPSRAALLMVYGHVDPEFTRRGVGAFLADFFEAKAAGLPRQPGGAVTVRHYLPSTNLAARALLEGRGYKLVRAVRRMERALQGVLPEPAWPTGITVRDYRGASDEPATYEAFELGSTGMWGRPGNDFAQWAPRAASYDRTLFKLAEADGAIVGISISEAPAADAGDGLGHVQSLRVVPAWRRRGLGAALLAQAFADLRLRGASGMWLTVDSGSPTGAPAFYRVAGLNAVRSYLVFEKQVAGRGGSEG